MNLPNRLTLLRVLLIPVFVTLMMLPGDWMQLWAMLVFLLASLTDFLDGHIARSRNLVTDFGKLMDPIADKLLVMAALVGLVAQGRANLVCALIILGREFVISGVRMVAVQKGVVIAAGMLGKIKTTLQIIAISMALFPFYGALHTAGQWLLWASAALSIWSCVDYILKNREVLS